MAKQPVEFISGSIISPLTEREYRFIADGAIVWSADTGKILFVGRRKDAVYAYPAARETELSRDVVILPGFVDLHVHLPQLRIAGTFSGTELLPWLQNYTWPEESKFQDREHAQRVAQEFIGALLSYGTTAAMAYGSVHEHLVPVAFSRSRGKMHLRMGNVLMDQNSPDYLLQDTQSAINITARLARKFKERFVVTPRFAPTCSMNLMRAVAKIRDEYGCFVQTHISENKTEVEWVRELFPEYPTYTHVYLGAGLLGAKTILGHAIHLSDKELSILFRTKTKIAHCPRSNKNLLSGRMPVERIKDFGIPFSLGSDVGAGDTLSMLAQIKTFFEVQKDHIPQLTPSRCIYYTTLAGSKILGIDAGALQKGKEASFAIFRRQGTTHNPDQLLESLWDDKESVGVVSTYFRGRKVFEKAGK